MIKTLNVLHPQIKKHNKKLIPEENSKQTWTLEQCDTSVTKQKIAWL